MHSRYPLTLLLLTAALALTPTLEAAPPSQFLTAPSSLTAVPVSVSQINLAWVDTNTGETGFAIERSLSATSGFVQIGTTGKDVTNYQSGGLASGTTYYVRVRATGRKSATSAYSNVTSATTVVGDSTPPTVSISSPASGSTYTTAQTVMLTATASDNVSVTRVEFYDGPTWKCTATAAPYPCTWPVTSANNGTHSWTAKAFDAATNTTTSSAVSLMVNIAANQPPVANAGPDQVTQTLTNLSFNGSGSYDPNGTIASYAWTFGDGGSATSVSVTHAYATSGTYTVTLTVTDNGGLTATDTAVVSVSNRPPAANAGPDQTGTAGTAMTFSGAGSSDPDGTITSYAWTFGDGSSSTGATVTHAYATVGTYTVALAVTDNKGATSSDTALATITDSGPPTSGTYMWSKGFHAASLADNAYPEAVAVDGSGNVVVAGAFRGTVDFGGGPLTSISSSDIFVAKFSASGAYLWSKQVGSTGLSNRAYGVTVDASGNILVTGSFQGIADFGGGPLTSLTSAGGSDIFLAKYSPTGAHLWSRRAGSAGTDQGSAVAVDVSGNILVTGFFTGTADFGGAPLTSAGGGDVFLAKYSPTGAYLWSMRVGGTSTDKALALTTDGNGNILLAGSFQGTVDFGGGSLTSAGGNDIFVTKYSATGSPLWSKRFGGPGEDLGYGIAVDSGGNAVVTGVFTGAVDFSGGTLPDTGGGVDIFIAKYAAADGRYLWAKSFGGNLVYGDLAGGVAVDPDDNVLVTGTIMDSVDFGGGPLWYTGNFDIFVAKFSPAGVHLWSKRAGAALAADYGTAVATDASGNVLVTGDFAESVDFGGGTLTSPGGTDGFLVKFGP